MNQWKPKTSYISEGMEYVHIKIFYHMYSISCSDYGSCVRISDGEIHVLYVRQALGSVDRI
jgi:hypothetical protein